MSSPLKIYNASAGSGKTFTLVKDLLQYILSSSDPKKFQEVLAMTFTNKAAQEMKLRVIKELKTLSINPTESFYTQEFLKALKINEKQLQRRSENILKQIIHNYSLFNISTIDTFNLRLMRSFAKDMGLSFNFDVEMDTENVIDEASHLFFSELEIKDEITPIIKEISLSKMELDKSWDVSHELTTQAKNAFQDEFREELENFHKKGIPYLNKYRKELKEEFFSVKNEIQQFAKLAFDLIQKNNISLSAFHQGNKGLPGFLNKNNRGEITQPNSYVIKFFEDEKLTSAKASEEDKTKIEEIFKGLENFYHQIIQKQIRFDLLQRIYLSINPLILLSELNKKVDDLRQDNNFLLISDFNKTIGEHLQEQPANFIYEKLGTRYKKFFIDEFQDTSRTQWNNLYPLIEDALSQNNEVGLVGDPKQSIYRFRGGDVNLMIELMNGKSFPPALKQLDTNWRSTQEVIDFTNHFFSWIAPQLPIKEFQEIYEDGNKQKATHKKEGYVRIEICDAKDSDLGVKEFQLEQMLQQILRLQENNYALKDIAILCRTRNEAIDVSEFLKTQEIPVISNESLLLIESTIIQLIQTFYKIYTEPNNAVFRFEFLSLLKMQGYIPEEEFAPFVIHNKDNSLENFLKALKIYGFDLKLNQLQNLSLYDLTENLIRILNPNYQDETYIIRYLDEVLSFQQKQKGGIAEWIDYFETMQTKLSINLPSESDAILIMTIHKSKGLEFPIVILPFIDWGVKPDGVWVDLENEPIDRMYLEKTSQPALLPENIRDKIEVEEAMATLDLLNVFYVATTRAENQLYVFSPQAKKPSKWLHKAMIAYVKEFGEENIYEKGIFKALKNNMQNNVQNNTQNSVQNSTQNNAHNENIEVIEKIKLKNYSEDWHAKIMVSTEHADLEKERNLPRITGNQIHKILEKIKDKDETSKVLSLLELEGIITSGQSSGLSNYLDKIYNHPQIGKFFKPLKILNERDFVTSNGEVFRPDRLVQMEDNQWVLIDYKTGAKNNSHKKQMNYYAEQLDKLGYPIHGKFLVYLHQEIEVEEFH